MEESLELLLVTKDMQRDPYSSREQAGPGAHLQYQVTQHKYYYLLRGG